ncbi:MAG: 23S rRNA (adenine(2503)-C(2))-methyltransferase RlmN [Deltaproteobacteria bacterium]|nr:23S rRNA (adenine(2503)-C(2))-methyltransferase RlmN [Candidatus Anaeroferrophillacea bacterium]
MKKDTSFSDLKDLTRTELAAFLLADGKERYRADQIVRWLYRQRVNDIAAMTNLSRVCREWLETVAVVGQLSLAARETAVDGTEKLLWELDDGQGIESVLIPDGERLTLCISTQVGCRQGCRFCLTARQGFVRSLRVGEIVDQVVQAQNLLAESGRRITNIVFMGMGEPLDNLEAVVRAVEIMKYDDGLAFSSRRITVSTCGLVPQMAELGRRVEVSLAVSLNAADDGIRSRLMPVNRHWPLGELLAACRAWPLKPSRRITFEYILIAGLNDRPEDARRLVGLLAPLKCKVNLIPFNEAPELPCRTPAAATVNAFQERLLASGLMTIVRKSRGAEISAACGQLRGKVRIQETGDRSRDSGDIIQDSGNKLQETDFGR